MKYAYLVLALLGTVLPYVFFVDFFQTSGLAPGGFIAALFTNGATGGFTVDLVVSSVAFWLYIVVRWRKHSGPAPWPFVALNLLIGLSCALPLFLYVDTLRQEKAAA